MREEGHARGLNAFCCCKNVNGKKFSKQKAKLVMKIKELIKKITEKKHTRVLCMVVWGQNVELNYVALVFVAFRKCVF